MRAPAPPARRRPARRGLRDFALPLSLVMALTACDDDAETRADSDATVSPADEGTPTPDGAAPNTGEGADAGPNDAGSADATPDAEPCGGNPPVCRDLQRQLGCSCISIYDRACLTDVDCRTGEVCKTFEDFDNAKICWLDPAPPRACPGGPECADNAGPLLAGAARRVITPRFEVPRPAGLDGSQMNFSPPFNAEKWADCGFDGLCPGDAGYTGPDEGEGDGVMQGAWMAGFTFGRPALYCPPEKIGCDAVDCCTSQYAHDELMANAVVLRQGETTIALVSLDVIGYFRDDEERIRAALPPEWGIDHLIIGATHNHEAPDTVGQWGPGTGIPTVTGREPYFLDAIQRQVIEAVGEAVGGLQPASAAAGVVDTGVKGLAISDSRAPYIFDDNLPILHLRRVADGAPIATVFSYGNHAETRWSENQHLTADYFGATRKYLTQGLPAVTSVDGEEKAALPGVGGVAVTFAGAVGGLINPGQGGAADWRGNTELGERHSWAVTDAVGQTLAGHLLNAIHNGGLRPLDDARLSFATATFLSGVTNQTFQLAAFNLGLIRRGVYNVSKRGNQYIPDAPQVLTETNLVRLGPLTLFTGPGEVFPETLVGGYPGRERVQNPVIGDVENRRVESICDADGLHAANDGLPCIIKAETINPPDWGAAPAGPYVYARVPGEIPFYIGLGGDFLGYMVPSYDYEAGPLLGQAPGDHYEETNGIGARINGDWETSLDALIQLDANR